MPALLQLLRPPATCRRHFLDHCIPFTFAHGHGRECSTRESRTMNADIRARTLLVKSLVRGVVKLAILGGVLFGIAGRVDWPAAWLVILLFTGQVLSGWWLFRHDPELFKERLTTASNVPHWDRLIARGTRILEPIFVATVGCTTCTTDCWRSHARQTPLKRPDLYVKRIS